MTSDRRTGAAKLATAAVPTTAPIGDPADMRRRRPGIRAAERQRAASNAAIGQAVALLGTLGFSATSTSDPFKGSGLSAIGASSISRNFLGWRPLSAPAERRR